MCTAVQFRRGKVQSPYSAARVRDGRSYCTLLAHSMASTFNAAGPQRGSHR